MLSNLSQIIKENDFKWLEQRDDTETYGEYADSTDTEFPSSPPSQSTIRHSQHRNVSLSSNVMFERRLSSVMNQALGDQRSVKDRDFIDQTAADSPLSEVSSAAVPDVELVLNFRIIPPFLLSKNIWGSDSVITSRLNDKKRRLEYIMAYHNRFQSGHPSQSSPTSTPLLSTPEADESVAQLQTMLYAGDIILPVVHESCSLVLFATSGSKALVHLKHLEKVEKANREVMSTMASDLTTLLSEKIRSTQATESNSLDSPQSSGNPPPQALSLVEQRHSLPIYSVRHALMKFISMNSICLIVGETGSGKTTQLVQYLCEEGYTGDSNKMIGCSQPRRIAAVGVAKRVSIEMGVPLGGKVGYAIHLDDCTSSETRIKFMTDGVLLREVVMDPSLMRYRVIVMDEAHERSVDTDVLLGVLKGIIRRRNDLKVIITSATMDTQKFSHFFDNAPSFTIPGRTFSVDIKYQENPVEDYVADAVFEVCRIHVQQPLEKGNDILVFMTGSDDVYGTCELIRRRLLELGEQYLKSLVILPCLSEANVVASSEETLMAPAPPGKRKCIVATNVAETSLTFDGVRYVIDSGFMKTTVFRPKLGMNTLQRYPISQSQANQRKGRAGRTAPGVCIRLYTERQFEEEMLLDSVPEIQRSSIDTVVLLLKSLGIQHLDNEFEFLDPPPAANIRSSLWHLWLLRLINEEGNLTSDGSLALKIPVAPNLARILLQSNVMGCSTEMVDILSMMSADPKTLFELPKGREELAQMCHSRFFVPDSDHLTLCNVFHQFQDHGQSSRWCSDHFLNVKVLQRAVSIRKNLLDRLRRFENNFQLRSCGLDKLDVVRHCLAYGLVVQSAKRSETNWSEYHSLINIGVVCQLHPSSALNSRLILPAYVVYSHLFMSTKQYMMYVTAVDGKWLSEVSQNLFKIKGKEDVDSNESVPLSEASSMPNSTIKTTSLMTPSSSSSHHPNKNVLAKGRLRRPTL